MSVSEWREVRIGDIGDVVTGKTPSSKNPEYFGDEIPFVTPTDYKIITRTFILLRDIFRELEKKFLEISYCLLIQLLLLALDQIWGRLQLIKWNVLQTSKLIQLF